MRSCLFSSILILRLSFKKSSVNVELEGESFEIGLNSRYLLEALKATETEQIEILFNGPNAGVVINEIDGESFKYVIMPQRLK